MDHSLGTRLRRQREEQQIPIDAIAATTKINPTLLEALERDDVSNWPRGIFRRAYIRDYARAIGLDPDTIVREFLEIHPDTVEVPAGTTVWGEPEGKRRLPAIFRGSQPKPQIVPEARPVSLQAKPILLEPTRSEPTLSAAAHLCARLGRVSERRDIAAVLAEAAELLEAIGVVVWVPAGGAALTAVFVHGYSEDILPSMTRIPVEGRTAVADAFRASDLRIVDGNGATGAVVVPIVARGECLGVLALELPEGSERLESVRACATVLAAQLAFVSWSG